MSPPQPPDGGHRLPPGAARVVVLPGSGSDAQFIRSAFGGPLAAVGWRLLAPAPRRGPGVVDGYRAALDVAAARPGPLLVGGVSLGAHVAATWAGAHPGRVDGLVLALPAWTGHPGDAPAALAARATAARLRDGGLPAALAGAAGAPPWLVRELARAWPGHGDGLCAAFEAAAATPAPDAATLARIGAPVGIAALVDDPVHPLAGARHWHGLLPRAAIVTTRLAALGADPAVLGRAAVLGLLRASTPAGSETG